MTALTKRQLFICLAIAIGVGARLALMAFGNNFDYDSYEIVGRLQSEGENVYAWTSRYNYGPVWFIILGWLWSLSELVVGDAGLFRLFVVLVLIAADLAIGFVLLRRFGERAAAFFILSPLSVFITGYHNQFDNLAIAIGLAAVLLLSDARSGPISRRQWAGLAVLGLSIATKHLLLFLPLWLAMRQDDWRRRVAYALVPGALFGASFLPWIYEGWWGIYDNVISYRSFNNAPLVNALTLGSLDPRALEAVGSIIFIVGMLAAGWMTRRLPAMTSLMVMLVALVVLAPAMANQYLAIPVAAMAAAPSLWFGLFTAAGTLLLIGNPDGLGMDPLVIPIFDGDVVGRTRIYDILILLLAAGGLHWWRRARAVDAEGTVDADQVAQLEPAGAPGH